MSIRNPNNRVLYYFVACPQSLQIVVAIADEPANLSKSVLRLGRAETVD
ncbi:hypothetical protein [Fischerella sp. JS2]|nr:hypothetical protein [Fischerella sp. JS2]